MNNRYIVKNSKIYFLLLAIILFSCNHNEEPPLETPLAISEAYLPVSVIFEKSDPEFLNMCMKWHDTSFEVNSVEELPQDLFGFNESYTGINFNEYTLLLVYKLHKWTIDTYQNRFVKNNHEDTFDWTLIIGASDFNKENEDHVTITRFAIKVRKLPTDAIVRYWWSITDYGFDW